jgi:hypothetical protein
VGWAQAELSVSNCVEARQQVDEARKLTTGFGSNDPQIRRLDSVALQLDSCAPGASPVLQSPSPVAP